MAMEFLSKHRYVSNQAAFLIVFVAGYLTATITTLYIEDLAQDVLWRAGFTLLCVMAFMTIIFVVSRVVKRTDVIDAAWGPAFVVAALASFFVNSHAVSLGWNTQTLVTILVIIWASRLSYHIVRRLMKHPEDKRYVALRKQWKQHLVLNAYTRIFLVQALLATAISIAVIHINLYAKDGIDVLAWVGVAVWLMGFLFEAVGDAQLKKHLANPKNKGELMTAGLWQYTRHPNYFGEALLWWGIFIIALSTPYGWVGILTPVFITYLLVYVSGIPMTEKAFEGRKGWSDYKKRTSMFIPMPPKQT